MIVVPLKLQFPIVPLHSGYDSGKWFTRATNDNCLSFVSHLGWATDISVCYHLQHASSWYTGEPSQTKEYGQGMIFCSAALAKSYQGASEIIEEA